MSDWVGHAQRELEREGYRLSGPRSAVVETLADLGCSVTAKEIADSLHSRGQEVGVASIYRTLELLDKLRLTRRVDAAEGVARYEPVGPSGEHHHHLVCESCGLVVEAPDRTFENLRQRLRNDFDFELEPRHFAFPGRCKACPAANGAEPPSPDSK